MPSVFGIAGFPQFPRQIVTNVNADIGAVEVKDSLSETRARVGSGVGANALRVVVASDQGAIPTSSQAASGSYTERSSSITAGGTSQQLAAANASRKTLFIENPLTATGQGIAAAESLYVRFGASAAGVDNGTAIEIPPGGIFDSDPDFVSTQAVQVNAATTGHKFIALEA